MERGAGAVMMKIWLVTNRLLCPGDFLKTVAEACRGGLEAVILREKDLSPAALYELARKVKSITDTHGVKLLISNSVEVASAVECDGVHLGREALPLEAIRGKLCYRGRVGVSVHDPSTARTAEEKGADYLLAGHIFPTSSKPGLPPGGLELLESIREVSSLPLLAIGGITPEKVPALCRQELEGIAVMSYIMQSPEPYRAVRELIQAQGK